MQMTAKRRTGWYDDQGLWTDRPSIGECAHPNCDRHAYRWGKIEPDKPDKPLCHMHYRRFYRRGECKTNLMRGLTDWEIAHFRAKLAKSRRAGLPLSCAEIHRLLNARRERLGMNTVSYTPVLRRICLDGGKEYQLQD